MEQDDYEDTPIRIDAPIDLTQGQVDAYDLVYFPYFFDQVKAMELGLEYVYIGTRKPE